MGFRDYYSIQYSKYITDKDIHQLYNLKKNLGYSDIKCGETLNIEMI